MKKIYIPFAFLFLVASVSASTTEKSGYAQVIEDRIYNTFEDVKMADCEDKDEGIIKCKITFIDEVVDAECDDMGCMVVDKKPVI